MHTRCTRDAKHEERVATRNFSFAFADLVARKLRQQLHLANRDRRKDGLGAASG